MPKTKTCNICNEEKSLDSFWTKGENRRCGKCRSCARTYKQYQLEGRTEEFWEEVADTSDESRLQTLKRARRGDPEAVGLWQIGKAMQENMSNEAADTKIMVRFAGSNLAA